MDLTLLDELKAKLNITRSRKTVLVGLAAVLIMVAAVTVGRFLVGAATATDFQVRANQADANAEAQKAEDPSELVFVHVSGAVTCPGVVGLAEGARVSDAVDAAGGFAQGAAPDAVNLARVVADGEQVIIPSEEDLAQPAESANQASQNAAAVSASAPAGQQGSLVNINTASAAELVSLPGIGQATADKIVSDRASNGPFKSLEDLKRVSGIGDKKFESLMGLICI